MNQEDVANMISDQEKETVDILIPPKAGTVLSVVFTWDGDFRSYFPFDYPNGWHHEEAKLDSWGHDVEWYVNQVESAIQNYGQIFLKLPQQARENWWVYIPTEYLRTKLKHIHLAWTDSPLATRSRAGERIAVPSKVIEIPGHGPGKRRR